ncbi:TPR repeat-containing protein [Chthoniobacter flavus Ellin428]|uniref:TPR repeat-containing protein n=1 Tax=Chthoniobacter flavus Ellin428 TaxID=497964 RepID=B4CWR3_9BACT|nr:tetratricopeptide repeat-containing glycosyltransferase family protein [Chthoniobacter flavus]EDY21855.1 TPR repeat-containing protein [Chthoniobacter flavus Ellin428]TCO95779.1 glycosyl transferase family 9 (putative heptosyltransferase) [Chthoniobacter flavus]
MPAIPIEQAFQVAAVLQQAGRLTEAETTYRQILTAAPHFLRAWVALGSTLSAMGRWPEAIKVLERTLTLDPNRPEIHFNLGNNHAKSGQWEPAIASFRKALVLRPNCAQTCTNLAGVLLEQDRLDEAIAHFQRALTLHPAAEMHYNLGVAYTRAARGEEAIACFRRALALRPDYANAHWALAPELMRRGHYEEGWRVYARYGHCPDPVRPLRKFPVPPWDGSRMEGETLLVHEEQGFGDAIQFLRYLPLLRERSGAARVLIECPAPLSRLIQSSALCHGMVIEPRDEPDTAPPACDRHIAFLDLPFTLEKWAPLSTSQPYLQAPAASREAWGERLGVRAAAGFSEPSPTRRWRVGLAWAGNPRQLNNSRRSLPPEKLLPLFQTPNVDFYSLQVRPAAGTPLQLRQAGLIDLTESIGDFADTAGLMEQLDLVITVDTSVAHLAGALGRPVWTLLSFVPDWRWGLEGEDSPWYSNMRLFRQPALGDWDAVIRRVSEELSALVAGITQYTS